MLDFETNPASYRKVRRRGLNRLSGLRQVLVTAKRIIYSHVYGMDIHPTAEFSLSARFDRTNSSGVHIGETSYIAFDACILTHDRTRGLYLDTWVERNCFVGARSIILPGIRIGEGSIVAAGSVVTKDVPRASIVAGSPAKVVKSGIEVGAFGRLNSADEVEHLLCVNKGL